MDYKLQITESGADLVIENGDLAIDNGLRTPVLVSLFSDARVEDPADLPDGETNPRGWWGDAFLRTPMGSLLWTLSREKITAEVQSQARVAAEDALAWLILDDLVEDVTVNVTRLDYDGLLLRIELTRGAARKGADLWESIVQEAVTFETPRLQVQILTA